ncbi:flagellar hook-length control protein FliK [Halothiobacillus sp.]|uniref:flagellar hook-length control protein FliK n=1 Tax=Halothiobacillus sp. TaxID=1891311 RepID=UPI002AD3D959|nr:flagellar hook-length control protein FliK [Halothiobacillus sp.]
MKVESPIISSTTTELRGVPLKQGQVLAAIVLRSSNANGEALLSLAGGQLSVQTRLPLQAGMALKLAVRDLGPPVILQPVTEGPTSIGSKPTQDTQNRLLMLLFQRTNQPAQGSNILQSGTSAAMTASRMMTTSSPQTTTSAGQTQTSQQANLTAGMVIAKNATLLLSALPAAVRTALPKLDVPPVPAIMASTLTKLVTTLSLPEQIMRPVGGQVAASDLKTQLKLAAQVIKSGLTTQSAPATDARSTPAPTHQSQVLSQLSEWVNRMDVSQLRTALQQVQGQPSWLIDVPVVVAEQPQRFRLTVSQEEEEVTQSGDAAGWQLDFSIDLPGLGPLHGSLHLKTTDLAVRLYADEPDSRQQLNQSLDQLAAHLRLANLNPMELTVYPGPPPNAVLARLTPEPTKPDGSSQYSWRV